MSSFIYYWVSKKQGDLVNESWVKLFYCNSQWIVLLIEVFVKSKDCLYLRTSMVVKGGGLFLKNKDVNMIHRK